MWEFVSFRRPKQHCKYLRIYIMLALYRSSIRSGWDYYTVRVI